MWSSFEKKKDRCNRNPIQWPKATRFREGWGAANRRETRSIGGEAKATQTPSPRRLPDKPTNPPSSLPLPFPLFPSHRFPSSRSGSGGRRSIRCVGGEPLPPPSLAAGRRPQIGLDWVGLDWMRSSESSRFVQELVLYAASAALSCLVLFAGLRQLDPNRAASQKALQHKKEIAKRLGRPLVSTTPYEVRLFPPPIPNPSIRF